MKFTAVAITALASVAAASPSGCKPGTYSCTPDKSGWQVCDVTSQWVVSTQHSYKYIVY